MEEYILLIEGKDRPGLIFEITGIIFRFGLNIISNHEYVDPENTTFFMRSEFVGRLDEQVFLTQLRDSLNSGFQVSLRKKEKKKIIVFASREHHCLADLLIREEFDTLNAEIVCIISNFSDLASLATMFNKQYHYIAHANLTRAEHERIILEIVDQARPDYLVLAKYMRIFTAEFVNQYRGRIVNIHHSFLPAFIGREPYEQAYDRGVKMIGATAHFVNEKLDEGPIIVQEVIRINHKYTIDDMRQAGKDAEVLALHKALKYVFEDRVFISGKKTILFN